MGGSRFDAHQRVVRAVTMIMGAVIGLTFLFGFGNVLALAMLLGVSTWVAPLVAPAVDLSVLGLLIGARHLALNGARTDDLRPARRLMIFASLVTLALNVSAPLLVGEFGKAAFDAVGPTLLIGWAEVGPGLLLALARVRTQNGPVETGTAAPNREDTDADQSETRVLAVEKMATVASDLVERARQADARHWYEHRRPISADALRRTLGVGSAKSRALVALIRAQNAESRDAA